VTSLSDLVHGYDASAPLERASTIPASWYLDERIFELERRSVFAKAWQVVGRAEQVNQARQFISGTTAGDEPIAVVRGEDGALRAFFNVCRHHAAAVVTEPEGSAQTLRCPYHGWTYGLDGALKGTPDFTGVCDFDRTANGLAPLPVGVWEGWVFVAVDATSPLEAFLGADLVARVAPLGLSTLRWMERRRYVLDCNWKVFVDNYLDGGYHVPHLHKGLDSVLDYGGYTIENGARFCLQSSPLVTDGAEAATGAVRHGDRAHYFWIYPNFMINTYGGAMDTNLVVPLGVGRTEVLFDFYFADVSEAARAHNEASIEIADRIQAEDVGICRSVQRGLASRAYTNGRLSVRREAGEHLFHRLLSADLRHGLRDS
jgi:choline monooxygenase